MQPEKHLNQKILILGLILILIVSLWIAMTMFKNKSAQTSIQTESGTQEIQTETQNQELPPAAGSSLMLKLDKAQGNYQVNQPLTMTVVGSSSKPVVGFDAVISFDDQAVKYDSATSLNDNFQVFPTKQTGKLYVTAGKKLSVAGAVDLKDTPLLSITFTPLQQGNYEFNLNYKAGDTTDSSLIDDQSNDILEQVSGVKISVE